MRNLAPGDWPAVRKIYLKGITTGGLIRYREKLEN